MKNISLLIAGIVLSVIVWQHSVKTDKDNAEIRELNAKVECLGEITEANDHIVEYCEADDTCIRNWVDTWVKNCVKRKTSTVLHL